MNYGAKTIIFPVRDLAKAKELYAQLLGTAPQSDAPYYVGFEVAGQQIGLDPNGHSQGMTGPVAFFHVDDIRGEIAAVVAGGGAEDVAPRDVGGGRLVARVRDGDGNVFGLIRGVGEPPRTRVSRPLAPGPGRGVDCVLEVVTGPGFAFAGFEGARLARFRAEASDHGHAELFEHSPRRRVLLVRGGEHAGNMMPFEGVLEECLRTLGCEAAIPPLLPQPIAQCRGTVCFGPEAEPTDERPWLRGRTRPKHRPTGRASNGRESAAGSSSRSLRVMSAGRR